MKIYLLSYFSAQYPKRYYHTSDGSHSLDFSTPRGTKPRILTTKTVRQSPCHSPWVSMLLVCVCFYPPRIELEKLRFYYLVWSLFQNMKHNWESGFRFQALFISTFQKHYNGIKINKSKQENKCADL